MAKNTTSAIAKFWIVLFIVLTVLIILFFVGIGIYSLITGNPYGEVLQTIFGIANDGTPAEVVTEVLCLTFKK